MAKGNDGNYLQHCIEVEAAARLAQAGPDGRRHAKLTLGSKFENTKRGIDQRRIERMDNWIEHAELVEDSKYDHIKFLFYWIAYEAAYKLEEWENPTEEYKLRCRFHGKISECKYAKRNLQLVLKDVKPEADKLLKLRQASRHFWYKKRRLG